jgi:DNA-directed RNA polymerase sigma subunit (sigma70/sigma32)
MTDLSLESAEKQALMRALEASNGNLSDAATALDVSRSGIYRKIVEHGLQDFVTELRVAKREQAAEKTKRFDAEETECAATLEEIAAAVGLSHQRVWQLLQSGLKKLAQNPDALRIAQDFAEHREEATKC